MASDDALADELRSLARTLHETVADDERRVTALDLLREANALLATGERRLVGTRSRPMVTADGLVPASSRPSRERSTRSHHRCGSSKGSETVRRACSGMSVSRGCVRGLPKAFTAV